MRLKMAENSLFAILLRSSWWISLAVALAFAAVSKAVLPDEYFIFGALGGFPFLVIACIAFWRQMRAPSAAQVEQRLKAAQALGAREFQAALTDAWRARGYSVSLSTHPGADLVLQRDNRTTVVACRRWKAVNHGVEPLRELLAAREAAQAGDCVYMAMTELSANAQKFAKDKRIELLGPQALATLLG